MSTHPYRQKAPSSAPYPVEGDFATTGSVASNGLSHHNSGSILQSPKLHNLSSITNNTSNTSSIHGKSPIPASVATPYPQYDSSTPPPVFASNTAVVSPPSNPLSATSSVTNFNLNQQTPNVDSMFSKSENNLPMPQQKYGHSRSVSSTSSFFYDRDNASMVDFSQNIIQSYLGSNSTHLMPRIKTIELYRKNAKKSNDPTVLFQYAQYMLQTALLLDAEPSNLGGSSSQGNTPSQSIENSPRKELFNKNSNGSSLSISKTHKKSKSDTLDLGTELGDGSTVDDKRLKRALLKEAVHYLKKLSDKGYVDAQYLLADAYSSGALDRVENREAFVLFQAAAKHGHIESAYRTSYCYEEGLGTGRDSRKSIEYLKMAASKNHPASMYKLGIYSFYGRMGMPNHINTKKSGIKWLERASNVANELVAAAPFELGKIYYNGFQDIVIADKKYALELYSQAAALGHVQSAALLGQFYEVGEIVPQDNNLSIHYYTQAALGGDPESMLAMCAWYLIGSDPFLPKDENEAFEWAKRAAVCNLPKAQFALANFYEKGIGCIKDDEEAQTWYKRAAEGGEEKSLERISDQAAATKLRRQIGKKRSGTVGIAKGSAAQEKDCVIM
ncbi:chitin synthase regulatory factor [Scheffersomyces stipitis CBS 6054]|uniref:Chitin synthase regulatory factor n=1 Tax=Scheffersomyces stipitis (strain ATCC 58785 / CBS 6054 / NBRC 10063 / NRRL Y-11545) TaxID=322104 RepID=A3LPX5_PICST|nr:chitin synthase regulatory factor [Scheffersomyces stipitis CBS 6054]ABN65116.2 chitin synthase regulatory factor [Scheffersomyces stipitis CBS 6054]